ncbi:class I SAM-dependent methyltransferase [Sphingomonas alpina]|uniref:Class I SAM-dependent methyltransferase n=1 Tax=Sphingomonas alpina TaxID=653931 RepID=A0A7H0LI63_9SPHN|nr:class I SAM-dependent methyltransferase [Sphingomonas alpina]QNQ09366.1 class I SAM-dependent methyltransferase [Sphingomonas alpina]
MSAAKLAGAALAALLITTSGSVPAHAKKAAAQSHKTGAGAQIAKALADPARADQANDDARRKAAEMLAFSGVKPGDRVIDFLPGSGYWTRIFTGVVGHKGHVLALWPAAAAKYAEKPLPELRARNLANVTAEVQTASLPTVDQPVDLFWTVQNYHDIPNNGVGEAGLNAFNAAVFKTLKPGGLYIVSDHADAPGSGLTGTETKHRIDPAVVKQQVVAAGFTFEGSSDVLANPADDHTAKVFDPAIRGKTDQFVFKFRKPR